MVIETHKEEKIRREILRILCAIMIQFPLNISSYKNTIRIHPFSLSFDIPETENEARLCIDGTGEEIIFRLDVSRKGTKKVFSHYLEGCLCAEIILFCFGHINRKVIYKAVDSLSKKVDNYWREMKNIQEDKLNA